tara:strand:+ start:981 stop:1514 length:534 start_codon:yes stop_codon:yes gene_type:complete
MWKGIQKNSKVDKQVTERGEDFVYTKKKMAIDLINNHTEILQGDKVMNTSFGNGAFYDNLPEYCEKFYCEIKQGIDYLDSNEKVDITLDNPPFAPRKLFWSFMLKAMENTNRSIYWLINMSALNVFTPKRLDEMKEKGFYIKNMHICSDKRWFGRYVWVRIDKGDNTNVFSWDKTQY